MSHLIKTEIFPIKSETRLEYSLLPLLSTLTLFGDSK